MTIIGILIKKRLIIYKIILYIITEIEDPKLKLLRKAHYGNFYAKITRKDNYTPCIISGILEETLKTGTYEVLGFLTESDGKTLTIRNIDTTNISCIYVKDIEKVTLGDKYSDGGKRRNKKTYKKRNKRRNKKTYKRRK